MLFVNSDQPKLKTFPVLSGNTFLRYFSFASLDFVQGISKDIIDKIFQPFFTTKPTGEGTGLGLSISYDVVTKVHGGELKVVTKELEGAEFIIMLPKV